MLASRTVSALMLHIMDVPNICIFYPASLCDLVRLEQCFNGSPISITKLEVRMKCGEMDWDFIAQVLQHPITHSSEFVVAIIRVGNHKIR